ncbi:MAG: hypothetical protein ACI8RZ_006846, partial [Myxococcota bacterium]
PVCDRHLSNFMVSEREGSHLTGFVGLTPSPRRVTNRQFTRLKDDYCHHSPEKRVTHPTVPASPQLVATTHRRISNPPRHPHTSSAGCPAQHLAPKLEKTHDSDVIITKTPPISHRTQEPMKLHISHTPGFTTCLLSWHVMLPLRGRGQLSASWFADTGRHSFHIKRHTFAMSTAERESMIETLRSLPSHLGARVDDVPTVFIWVEGEQEHRVTRTLFPAVTTDNMSVFDTIIDTIWPEVQAALLGAGLDVDDWR